MAGFLIVKFPKKYFHFRTGNVKICHCAKKLKADALCFNAIRNGTLS